MSTLGYDWGIILFATQDATILQLMSVLQASSAMP